MKIVDMAPAYDILGNAGRKPEPKVSLPAPKVFDLMPGKLAKVEANTDREQVAQLALFPSLTWKG